ncbi:hypothetical protein B0G52_11114 [Cohnella sp. SGD-V74]|uniref:hypothetical protein n=1 Tax=unclassified Cohnella TaxID=2636738 RepID=UPI000D4B5F4F|nr:MULTISPECIES: hypothetical protein [unclassified Cohnella]PRX70648.1 hypothetical protein B0G52_11114 [Cohnella sp. SGD-V74]
MSQSVAETRGFFCFRSRTGEGAKPTKLIKLLALVAAVSILNVVVLSPGLVGVGFGESALETAIGVTLPLASVVALLLGSYAILHKPQEPTPPLRQLQSREDFAAALSRYKRVRLLEEDIEHAVEQLDRIRKKKETLLQVLSQRFQPEELSYSKFASAIAGAESLFYRNVRSVLNRLQAFDESEFESLGSRRAARMPRELLQMRAEMLNEFLGFVKYSIGMNEEILLKLDRLLLEITRLDAFEPGDIEEMPCMKEIDALIRQTKHYR